MYPSAALLMANGIYWVLQKKAIQSTVWFIYHVKRSIKKPSVISKKTQHKGSTLGLDLNLLLCST